MTAETISQTVLATQNAASLKLFVPELLLIGLILIVIVFDLVRKGKGPSSSLLSLCGLGLVFLSTLSLWKGGTTGILFSGMVAVDALSTFFKLLFIGAAFASILAARRSRELEKLPRGEFHALLLGVTLGMMLLASARNLLMIYLSLETVSMLSYCLAGYLRKDRRSAEASLKYVLYGAVASGVMIFGMSLLYGLSGTLDLDGVLAWVNQGVSGTGEGVLFLSVVFILAGLGYKMAAAPFHMWAPDVYEGSPIVATAFFSIGPKLAGFAAAIRFFCTGLLVSPAGAFTWPMTWDDFGLVRWVHEGSTIPIGLLLAVVSVATMTLGNLAALRQENIKRLLAYSSIAHSGYALMGLVLLNGQGIVASCFYLVVYALMNLGAFIVAIVLHRETSSETISSYKGLAWRAPFIAVAMAFFLFSLTGVPPFAGFIGKVYLFGAVVNEAQAATTGAWANVLYALVIVGVLNSVISLYYYARVVGAMFLNVPARRGSPLSIAPSHFVLVLALAVPTLLFGIWWTPLYSFAARAVLGFI